MTPLASSFRDPAGFLFTREGRLYRQINRAGAAAFDAFMDSGLYEVLVSRGLLIPHEEEADLSRAATEQCHRLILPELVPYISYPYEWSFGQLQAAAMLTLRVQSAALKMGFVLRDASAFNVQFIGARPVFIDTLSFAPYVEGSPWDAYRQFCQHFLAPLALMAYTDVRLSKLALNFIDGVPLDLASRLLPWRTRLNLSLATHIHLHARMQRGHADDGARGDRAASGPTISKTGLLGVAESLAKAVDKLVWRMPATEWGEYYDNTNYSAGAALAKRELVRDYLAALPGPLRVVQDLGANNGEFSRIAAGFCHTVVSQDIDPVAVELNFRRCKQTGPDNILPLLQDLATPSPAIGWANAERDSFMLRGACDVVQALALIHHLAIGNNVPLASVAAMLAGLGRWLIIEFVPRSDSQVKTLLATRKDVFPDYTREGFEAAFRGHFQIRRVAGIPDSERTLYLMERDGLG